MPRFEPLHNASRRCHALFGHVGRPDATTSARQALNQVISMKGGQSQGTSWRSKTFWASSKNTDRSTVNRQQNAGSRLETDVAECRGM